MTDNEKFQYINLARQLQKMCESHKNGCEDCPFRVPVHRCMLGKPCNWRVEDCR